jgi:hypothetical protein
MRAAQAPWDPAGGKGGAQVYCNANQVAQQEIKATVSRLAKCWLLDACLGGSE